MQVILGLQSNALKYTHKGYVKLIVSINEDYNAVSESMEPYLSVIVEDTGLGIKQDDE